MVHPWDIRGYSGFVEPLAFGGHIPEFSNGRVDTRYCVASGTGYAEYFFAGLNYIILNNLATGKNSMVLARLWTSGHRQTAPVATLARPRG